ncbi:hypothetical protein AAFF_G00159640 [Aldrovandia affinis]|uniref:Reverse transcriptase/retrotransposon-derived protein RNase H-like domain-containing protein n=1 Tax=Aldrovandia affinis TaxID=143900 RepID=A0AAD7RN36_9TELE|nr:hypothetical protein AAFF_G00159640 [Aldrovandia affinis]
MEKVLQPVPASACVVYLDNILVHASTYAAALTNLRTVFELIAKVNLRLTPLTEKGQRFTWLPASQDAFHHLCKALITAPILAIPDPTKPFILDTDASNDGAGAILSQAVKQLEAQWGSLHLHDDMLYHRWSDLAQGIIRM